MALTKLNYTGQDTIPDASLPTIPISKIPTITGAKMPAGSVIQTKHVVMKGIQRNTTTNSYTLISDGTDSLQLSITPISTSSKILITSTINSHSHNAQGGGFIVIRGSSYNASNRVMSPTSFGSRTPTNIGGTWTGDASGDDRMVMNVSSVLLDSPSTTSATTYGVYCTTTAATQGGTSINAAATDGDTDNADYVRTVSTFTLQEIAG